MNASRVIPLLILGLGGVGCGADVPPESAVPDAPPKTVVDNIPLAELARTTLSEAIGVPAADITVESIEPVEWRDGSLGCPQPGMSYAAVITPGHRILLRVGDQLYPVHEANGRAKVCRIEKR